jgi:hypothetical protein
MFEYDCCIIKDNGSGFDYETNIMVIENLSAQEDNDLKISGFIIRVIGSTEHHIIANRDDTMSMFRGCDFFWKNN